MRDVYKRQVQEEEEKESLLDYMQQGTKILSDGVTGFSDFAMKHITGIKMDLEQMTGLIPSTFQVVFILGIMALVSFLSLIHISPDSLKANEQGAAGAAKAVHAGGHQGRADSVFP